MGRRKIAEGNATSRCCDSARIANSAWIDTDQVRRRRQRGKGPQAPSCLGLTSDAARPNSTSAAPPAGRADFGTRLRGRCASAVPLPGRLRRQVGPSSASVFAVGRISTMQSPGLSEPRLRLPEAVGRAVAVDADAEAFGDGGERLAAFLRRDLALVELDAAARVRRDRRYSRRYGRRRSSRRAAGRRS